MMRFVNGLDLWSEEKGSEEEFKVWGLYFKWGVDKL